MSTEIIILAQGTQQRLGAQHGYKQLLPLPACGGVPILMRTLRQLKALYVAPAIAVVGWEPLFGTIRRDHQDVACYELPNPGNSSLKGIARYLDERERRARRDLDSGLPVEVAVNRGHESTLVLLGDVVYSWHCLISLMALTTTWGFAGTRDLSASGGELWGVAWSAQFGPRMQGDLRDALLRHPPFEDEYQPGQLRRWLVGWRRGDLTEHVRSLRRRGTYIDVDDYTMDVDLPHHIPALGEVSIQAAADDARHGLTWSTP
jgi:MobA-like NTP transferase domain